MGRESGKRAVRKRAADLAGVSHEDDAKLERVTARRLARLEKDLAAAHKAAERHRSRLAAASAEADEIRGEIATLLRRASEPAVGDAKKVGQAAADLIEDAADVMADAAGGVVHAAGAVVGAARRSIRGKPAEAAGGPVDTGATPAKEARVKVAKPTKAATVKASEPAEDRIQPLVSATKPKKPATTAAPKKPAAAAAPKKPATTAVPKPAVSRPARARRATPPETGPENA